ncbi:MAG: LON peptidase substrate-binding domain-containing protein [Planctomycetes bacterium]|nr:LON peptidase substrate-binding domain-containing protein [Planctomycetota bacterium]
MLPWNAEDLLFDQERFTGKVRLFPLPDLVMFPHVMQPLHVFEPRYRDLLNEALDSDGLIAMSVLSPGWENGYEGCPAVFPHACLGKVVTHERTDDGQYNVLLLGLRRVQIDSELPPEKSFRQANVTLLDDCYETENTPERLDLQTALIQQFEEALPGGQNSSPNLSELLSSDVSLGVLTDLVSFALPLEFQLKCKLLGESDIDVRAIMLLDALESGSQPIDPPGPSSSGTYLPPFSQN